MIDMVQYVSLIFSLYLIRKLIVVMWLKPKKIQKFFLDQGVTGPLYKPFIGSLGELASIYVKVKGAPRPSPTTEANPRHATLEQVYPHLNEWRNKYGRVFLYWYGNSPRLTIMDPKLIKEVTSNARKFKQSIQHPVIHNLLGGSIVSMGGETWATRRRLLSPLFLLDYLKGLSGMIQHEVEIKLEAWHKLLETSEEVEIDVHKELEDTMQRIIARTIFGNDADEGLHIVHLQAEQAIFSSQSVKTFYIPGSRFLPTKFNQRSKWLRQEVDKRLNELIRNRVHMGSKRSCSDWLGLMLSSNDMTHKQIADDICSMVFAGSDTTALTLTWACMLLSIHTEWQDKVREEIHQLHKGRCNQPKIDELSRLKVLNMIINETLRLYPPAPYVMKKTIEEIAIEGITIPPGIDIEMPIIGPHHDPQQWGDNVDQFDPSRFSEGTAKAAKHPMAFMPFMIGPRICMGMNFSMMEARIALSLIISNFKLMPSPNYKHEPAIGMMLKPAHETFVIFQKI